MGINSRVKGGKRGVYRDSIWGESTAPSAQRAESIYVLGVDPGLTGAFVVTDGKTYIQSHAMPVSGEGKEKRISFQEVCTILHGIKFKGDRTPSHVFLERPVSFGMSTNSAFNYGRGFEAVTLALVQYQLPLTLVEPSKWTKEMHEGISSVLKPKPKSLIAVKRLFPQLVGLLPVKPRGGLHDGPVDALLIAGYGLRKLGLQRLVDTGTCEADFY